MLRIGDKVLIEKPIHLNREHVLHRKGYNRVSKRIGIITNRFKYKNRYYYEVYEEKHFYKTDEPYIHKLVFEEDLRCLMPNFDVWHMFVFLKMYINIKNYDH